jgi:hypothetical protein
MQISELLAIPRLHLRFLSGAEHAHRRIRWAYTTDLLEPGPTEQGNAGRSRVAPDGSATMTVRMRQGRSQNGSADAASTPLLSGREAPDPPTAVLGGEQADAPDHDTIGVTGRERRNVRLLVACHLRRLR